MFGGMPMILTSFTHGMEGHQQPMISAQLTDHDLGDTSKAKENHKHN